MFKEKAHTKFILFYVVVAYVFVFMLWWSFLLYAKTNQHYSDAVNFKSLEYQFYSGRSSMEYFKTDEFYELNKKFNRQKWMIAAEGGVFFVILLIGIYKVYLSFKQEIELAKQQKNFILSITHELKSPLSGIKLVNETLIKRDLPKEKQHQLLLSGLSEVDRLEALVENILIAAKIENNKYGFSKETLSLSSICSEICLHYEHRNDLRLLYDIEPNIEIKGDKVCLHSILSNLLENAIKYTENGKVNVKLIKENAHCILSVADEGNGISKKDKEKVFDKFYRVGNEETRAAKGTGLGLFIVKQLVLFHNGTIWIEDNTPQGTIFNIRFPI